MFLKKVLVIVVTGVFGISTLAELVKNPDSNTLWIENGKDIKTSEKNTFGAWRTSNFTIIPGKDKGFMFISDKATKTGCYLPVSPEYPWFCWKIESVKNLKSYRALSMGNFSGLKCNRVNVVSTLFPGYYAVNIVQNSELEKNSTKFLRVDQYGFETTFEYIKMVKKPDYYIEVTSDAITAGRAIEQGDTLTFTLYLKESAEEATLSFYRAYAMPKMKINGKSSFAMKTTDKDNKVWNAKIKLDKLSPTMGKGKTFKRNGIVIKAVVELEESMISVFTSMPAPVNIK